MIPHDLIPHSSPTLSIWLRETAQGDGEQPTRVVSTMMVEDVSPTSGQLRQEGSMYSSLALGGQESLALGAFAAGIPSGRKDMLPGGAWGTRDLQEHLLGMVAGSGYSATPSSVITLLDPQRAGLLLEDASPNHLGQLLGTAPGVGLHTGPGAGQSVEALLRAAAQLQHF